MVIGKEVYSEMARKGENIYKRKDGRWEGRYIVGRRENGQARYASIYGKSYLEVKEKLEKRKGDRLRSMPSCQLTVKIILDMWLSLRLTDDAEPEGGYYFNGEFWYRATGTEDDPVLLGSVTENGWTRPVTEFTMPAYAVTVGAVQAQRETMTLAFVPGASRSLPLEPWMQLQMFGSGHPLILYDDASGIETLDVNLDGTGDLLITHPDETTTDITLTLLAGCTAFGTHHFTFTGATERYGTISFALLTPVFGTADFTLPSGTVTVGESAFENDTQITAVDAGSVTSIGVNAFKGCTGLTKIRLPKDCTIAGTAFDGCTALEAIFAPAGGTTEQWADGHQILFVAE